MVWEKYTSRKFIVVNLILALSFLFTVLSKMSPELSTVFLSAIASYGVANAWVDTESSQKYASRKFIVTLVVVFGATGFAYFTLLNPPLSNVLAGAIGSYNLTSAWRESRDDVQRT